MAKSRDYWRMRMEALADEQFLDAEEVYQDIQKQYRSAMNSIQRDIEVWYQRLAENNDISYAAAKRLLKKDELEEFQWTVEEYIKVGKKNAVSQEWMKELENASAKYHISRLEALKLQMQQHAEFLSAKVTGMTTEYLQRSFSTQFYHTAYEIAKGIGVGTNLARLDTRRIEMMLTRPWARDGKNFSDRIWDNKEKLVNNLHTELTQCIIRGEDPQKAINRLAKAMNTSKNQAGNLIMTETAAISAVAQEECFRELDVEEFEVVETIDGITCELCQEMDKKHFPMSDYEIGLTAPPFHPRCRGCTAPYFNDEFSAGGQRAARDPDTGETYYIPESMTYNEWKEKFVRGEQMGIAVEERGEKGYNVARSRETLQAVAEQIRKDIPQYTQIPSKWSGKINIDNQIELNGTLGEKEWNCDVTVIDTADDGVLWHELLHSCSVSYYDEQVYLNNKWIEESSVEFLKQQVCKERRIKSVQAYKDRVMILQLLNEKFAYGTDMEFSRELFNVPLPERYQWLENKVDNSLREKNVDFADYYDVMNYLKYLEGGE